MKIDVSTAQWINQPKQYEITDTLVKIITEPKTDFWQRTYYGSGNDNGSALLMKSDINFSFTATFEDFEYEESLWQAHSE